MRPINSSGPGIAGVSVGGSGSDKVNPRLLQAVSESRRARVITDIVDVSIERSREARAERQDRDREQAVVDRRDARKAEQEANAARSEQKRAESERVEAERDAQRQTTLNELGGTIDVFG